MSEASAQPIAVELRRAFLLEAAAVQRYTYFAQLADIEGHGEAARLLSQFAQSSACAAHGHLDQLRHSADPAPGDEIGNTQLNLAAVLAGELKDASQTYPDLVRRAFEDGLADTASWMQTVGALKQAHVARLQEVLTELVATVEEPV
jgi:rubrerythrin